MVKLLQVIMIVVIVNVEIPNKKIDSQLFLKIEKKMLAQHLDDTWAKLKLPFK